MGDYFKPLRRKFGVLTLVMACVFLGAWVRTFVVWDVLTLPFGHRASLEVRSTSDQVLLSYVVDDDFMNRPLYSTIHRHSQGARPSWDVIELGSMTEEIQSRTRTQSATRTFVGSTHFAIVISLTLLSAWLLLSKPRKKESKPDFEPNSKTVT